jgi:adenylosuccinate synthase
VKAGGGKIGTTKQGIGPAYAAKASRNALRFGLLKHRDAFRARLRKSIAEHQLMYQFDYDVEAEIAK